MGWDAARVVPYNLLASVCVCIQHSLQWHVIKILINEIFINLVNLIHLKIFSFSFENLLYDIVKNVLLQN